VSAEDLLGWPHVDLRAARTAASPVDDAFAQRGLCRPTVGEFFRAASAIEAARRLDSVLVAPVYATRGLLEEARLRRVDTGFDLSPAAVVLAWHERLHRDPAQAWLQGVVAKSVRKSAGSNSLALGCTKAAPSADVEVHT
jgi:DNA-binding transcriptional LysR family regulator